MLQSISVLDFCGLKTGNGCSLSDMSSRRSCCWFSFCSKLWINEGKLGDWICPGSLDTSFKFEGLSSLILGLASITRGVFKSSRSTKFTCGFEFLSSKANSLSFPSSEA